MTIVAVYSESLWTFAESYIASVSWSQLSSDGG